MKIEDLGYNNFFESKRKQLGLGSFPVARVISEARGLYKIKNESGEFLAKVTGKQMFEANSREDYPAVGDFVAIEELNKEQAVIKAILPRLTVIKRKFGDKNRAGEKNEIQIIAANIDIAFVIESVDRDFSLNRFERYFAILKDGGVEPAIILNKIDLISEKDLQDKIEKIKNRFPNIDFIQTSTINGGGLEELKKYIEKGRTYCFLGSSGVGKSSLINRLIEESVIKVGEVSEYSGRGKHVTTGRQMYFLEDGGIVIDNPGIREVGMADVSEGIDEFFGEIADLGRGCKYKDCTHIHEDECRVLDALNSGRLDAEKYANYLNLKKESEFFELNSIGRREKDKDFGKFVNKMKKVLKNSNLNPKWK
jgi:ribosome biogenesis GTPase / thiamine phosphate phosphatase